MSSADAPTGCPLCERAAQRPDAYEVHRDDEWIVYVNPAYGRRGALWVLAREHAEGLWDLSDRQAASFGSVVRTVAQALHDGVGAEKVYMVSFGENYSHVHALMVMREEGASERGVALVGSHLAMQGGSTDEAGAFADEVRAGLT